MTYLLPNVVNRRTKKFHKDWDSTMVYNHLIMLRYPRSNVCESPSSLKLLKLRKRKKEPML